MFDLDSVDAFGMFTSRKLKVKLLEEDDDPWEPPVITFDHNANYTFDNLSTNYLHYLVRKNENTSWTIAATAYNELERRRNYRELFDSAEDWSTWGKERKIERMESKKN